MINYALLKFITLPEIKPRFTNLFGRGFFYIPFFIALVYQSVRLLPRNHPYTLSENIGKFGLTSVIAEAANNLVLKRKNTDQMIVFGLVILAIVLITMQILLMVAALFIHPSFSFPTNFEDFFLISQTAAEQDIAHILMDMTFGIPDLFNSCVSVTSAACQDAQGNDIKIADGLHWAADTNFEDFTTWPYPIHVGLHQLFAMYSYGLLIVAMMITIYFIVTIFAETAQSGTAFGKRFNKVWAPVRIVVAFGLLVPISSGLNSAQYITLYSAKFGSAFATNGWNYFNASFTDHYHEGVDKLVATPNFPETGVLLQFFNVAAVCKHAYVQGKNYNYTSSAASTPEIMPFLVKDPTSATSQQALAVPSSANITTTTIADADITSSTTYDDMISFNSGSNKVIVRFGDFNPEKYGSYLGHVKPYCGEVVLLLENPRTDASADDDGIELIQRFYWWLIKALWWTDAKLDVYGNNDKFAQYYAQRAGLFVITGADTPPPTDYKANVIKKINEYFNKVLTDSGSATNPDDGGISITGGAIAAQIASSKWAIDPQALEKGWAGAALWYNKIADMNGRITSAILNIPMPSKYPYLMEYTKTKRFEINTNALFSGRFDPAVNNNEIEIPYIDDSDKKAAIAMNEMSEFWDIDGAGSSTATTPTGNIIIDTINAIVGTNGLFNMQKNTDTHPLAQLVGVGKALVESSIRNLGYAAIGGTLGALISSTPGEVGKVFSGLMITFSTVGLTAGFILFYIVPFLPFIYFFFAVGGWVKGIFEAMVGVPLWALAHIRIDGNGLPGQAAINGYFLILEIFLRPILTVFGFLASILILSAMVEVLHDLFNLVVSNVGGYDMAFEKSGGGPSTIAYYRSALDQFFYTIVYAIIVYMMAQSSFKLIDLIPNNILRWMGSSVATFNDSRQDPAEGLTSRAQIGAQQTLSNLGGGIQGVVDAASKKAQ